jgi:2-methylcitrate dehydratase
LSAPAGNRPPYDGVIDEIAEYVAGGIDPSTEAMATARLSLLDALGCGLLALSFPQCTKLLGPVVEGTVVPHGARVPGTPYRLDPVKAAWDTGTAIRWLDYNDTWLAAEWGHPSDNLGGILAVADHISQRAVAFGEPPFTMADILRRMVAAHEIQGVLALGNGFNRVGLDHVLLVRVASTAVITAMLGGTPEQLRSAISHAWTDGGALRTYRHAPNAGSRKSWAAGDATSRAVQLAAIALRDEMGVPSVLTAPQWGFQDVLFSQTNADLQRKPDEERAITLARPLGSYVMEHVLFKVSYPAEFHAQTAAEAAIALHPQVGDRLDEIERIEIATQESAVRIISKDRPLANPADRDHCLEYITAVGLAFGELTAEHYEDRFHEAHPIIDRLHERTVVEEDPAYSRSYRDPDERSIANRITVVFEDGSRSDTVEVVYPLGHRRRRDEALPRLMDKFAANVATRFPPRRCEQLLQVVGDQEVLEQLPVHRFVDLLVP